MPVGSSRDTQSAPCPTASRGSTPRLGAPASPSRFSGRLSTSAVVPVETPVAHHVPPATRSRPPTTSGCSGHHRPGSSNGRVASSSRRARIWAGRPADQRTTTVHTRASSRAYRARRQLFVYLVVNRRPTSPLIGSLLL